MSKSSRIIITAIIIQFLIGFFIIFKSNDIFITISTIVLIITFSLLLKLTIDDIKGSNMDTIRLRELSRSLSNKNWELARLNEQLRITNERKSEFISIASHQLRTPLTALTGYLSMILEKSYGPVPIELNTPISRAHKSSLRLTNLVNELLHISRIEQGDLTYDITPIDAVNLIHEVLDEFNKNAVDKNLDLSFNVTPNNLPYIVYGDERKLTEVLHNLVDNAIIYTPKGSVTINIGPGEGHTTLITISDTGIGIAHEDIRLLFAKFQRGEGGAKEFTDGSGLGLYISKKLICGMRGKIWIESEGVGKGAVFSIQLPNELIEGSKPPCCS